MALYADPENRKALAGGTSLVEILRTHIARANAGDYLALLAYIERNAEHSAALTKMRVALRQATRCATCVGFGPRFLHSTGQAYKGGPNSGVFIEITADPKRDLLVPGKKYSFGVVELAQAQGDLAVLAERNRRALQSILPVRARASICWPARSTTRCGGDADATCHCRTGSDGRQHRSTADAARARIVVFDAQPAAIEQLVNGQGGAVLRPRRSGQEALSRRARSG